MNEKVGEIDDAILAFTLVETVEALRILSQLTEIQPESIDVWRALAEVQLSIGKTHEAERACLKALEINSEDLTSMVSLARILVKKGDKEGAEEASAKARVLGWKEELAQENEDG